MAKLKLLFAGTPAFAARQLQAIIDSRHQVVAAYTQPDRPAGRGKLLQPSPVKSLALANSIPVFQPVSLKGQEQVQLMSAHKADLMVVVAYGLILPQSILNVPSLGCINIHASLLPRWRGAAPIERAILAGDEETGITIMQMDAGLDTGSMLYRTTINIAAHDTSQTLTDRLSSVGADAIVHVLDNFQVLSAAAQSQDDSLSSYASKIEKREALINWNLDAQQINRLIRVGIGRYPAYSYLNGQRIRLLQAEADSNTSTATPGTILKLGADIDKQTIGIACKDSILLLNTLQFAGKNPMSVKDARNSRQDLLTAGARFSDTEESF